MASDWPKSSVTTSSSGRQRGSESKYDIEKLLPGAETTAQVTENFCVFSTNASVYIDGTIVVGLL